MLKALCKNLARFTIHLIFDQGGETPGDGADGDGDGQAGGSQADGDQGDGTGAGDGQGQDGSDAGDQGGAGQGADDGAAAGTGGQGKAGGSQNGGQGAGQFGGFKTVEELIQNFQKVDGEFKTLKGKQTATERNLSLTRSALKRSNLVMDDNGNISMQPKTQARQKKFTDQHANLFEKNVLEGIKSLMEDFYEEQQEKTNQRMTQEQQFFNERQEAVGLMFDFFPQLKHPELGGTAEIFNEAFHDTAIALYKERYSHLPNGELIAALKTAQLLKIPAQAIAAAKKQGFQQGQTGRRILGPVGKQQGAAGQSGAFKPLAKAEFLKLGPEAREKYKQDEIESRKPKGK